MRGIEITKGASVMCDGCGTKVAPGSRELRNWKLGWKSGMPNVLCPLCRGDKHADKPLADKVVL